MITLRLPYRLRQVAEHVFADGDDAPAIPASARLLLTPPMLHQFRILPVIDQRHLLGVYALLVEMNAEPDTITAGLIHDVGKACAKCRITVLDRGLHVILRRAAPAPYRVFAGLQTAPPLVRGLHRLANHAERGALAGEQAGYNQRVIDLVRHHESGGDPFDIQLQMLRRADQEAGRI